ncbi:unnamed protein product [Didymodactylos carnosus]|uniref:Hint domain-containing protein n=1 Tax=Didymodactylos carnosus TaxID=1234261 RepID=A0A815ZL37_9BILA|nr:unnamed protein product [Didymodactylos carnosus]CAF4452926.1 unnamed protein product [Didymodactylos carnosus]
MPIRVAQTQRKEVKFVLGSGCFYGGDLVHLIDGGKRSISKLKVGDPIWSLNLDGNGLIEDEIVLMMHNEANKSALFYTFTTSDCNEVSLTDSHNIPVYCWNKNKIEIILASKVTINDRLIMYGKKVEIKNISINIRQGFYSPLTVTGYLFVNNISTSVFSDNYKVSSSTVQFVFTPIRIYYHLMRWIYGNGYIPFAHIQQGLHPIPAFYKKNIKHNFDF